MFDRMINKIVMMSESGVRTPPVHIFSLKVEFEGFVSLSFQTQLF